MHIIQIDSVIICISQFYWKGQCNKKSHHQYEYRILSEQFSCVVAINKSAFFPSQRRSDQTASRDLILESVNHDQSRVSCDRQGCFQWCCLHCFHECACDSLPLCSWVCLQINLHCVYVCVCELACLRKRRQTTCTAYWRLCPLVLVATGKQLL